MTCPRCGLPRAPYGYPIPTEQADAYCWGASEVGISYCLTHHRTRNEDEDGLCEWAEDDDEPVFDEDGDEHPRPCRLVALRYDHRYDHGDEPIEVTDV